MREHRNSIRLSSFPLRLRRLSVLATVLTCLFASSALGSPSFATYEAGRDLSAAAWTTLAQTADPANRLHPTGFFQGWFVSQTTGWVVMHSVNGEAVLSRTDDGGIHWQPQLPLEYPKLFQRNMSFVSGDVGFVAVGTLASGKVQPRLFSTINGGRRWIAKSLPASGSVAGLDFVSPLKGWVLEQGPSMTSTLYNTQDGGNTWSECIDPKTRTAMRNIDKTDHLEGIRFPDARHGWIAGWETGKSNAGAALYYYTADGCATWQKFPLVRAQQRPGAESVYFVDPPRTSARGETGVVVVARGNPPVFRTSVFVKTKTAWSEIEVKNSFDLRSDRGLASPLPTGTHGVQFLGGGVGFAEASDSTGSAALLRTVDAGTSWSRMEPNMMRSTASATSNRPPMAVAEVAESCCIPPCSDTGCNGVDPQSSGCSAGPPAAYTVAYIGQQQNGYKWDDELRYESWCSANWGRTTCLRSIGPNNCPSEVSFESSSQGYYDLAFNDGIYTTNWTWMKSGSSSQDRVCRWHNSGICTLWF